MSKQQIDVNGLKVTVSREKNEDYISLTDMARFKNSDHPRYVIHNWMKTHFTVEFMGNWEILYNPNFNRIEFDTVKSEVGHNYYILTPDKWIKKTNAMGIVSKSGRYGGGTFAHKDIAFEFGTWLSPEFKLYLIKEFQRLKQEEVCQSSLKWNLSRELAKVNYQIHTDSINQFLIPPKVEENELRKIYASEADILNKALFGITASEWKKNNTSKSCNIRDYANITQLICLSNLESINAELIRQKKSQSDRLLKLNEIAIYQMKTLIKNESSKKLK